VSKPKRAAVAKKKNKKGKRAPYRYDPVRLWSFTCDDQLFLSDHTETAQHRLDRYRSGGGRCGSVQAHARSPFECLAPLLYDACRQLLQAYDRGMVTAAVGALPPRFFIDLDEKVRLIGEGGPAIADIVEATTRWWQNRSSTPQIQKENGATSGQGVQ
jgi:hypothetical protein